MVNKIINGVGYTSIGNISSRPKNFILEDFPEKFAEIEF